MKVVPSVAVATIDKMFPHASRGQRDGGTAFNVGHAQNLRAVVSLARSVPDGLIRVADDEIARLSWAIAVLETAELLWTSDHQANHRTVSLDGKDPVTVIREVLAACQDDYEHPATAGLEFIADEALRRSLIQDVSDANRSLENGDWKAATVMAGAAIEGLLHWRLKADEQGARTAAQRIADESGTAAPDKSLDRWALETFLGTAAAIGILSSDAEKAGRLAKDFRNLIHPGRAARTGKQCNRATALMAVGALQQVILELAREIAAGGSRADPYPTRNGKG